MSHIIEAGLTITDPRRGCSVSPNVVEGEAACRIEYAKWICDTKQAHNTNGKARIAALGRLAADNTLQVLYGYKCPACWRWHLTKKKTKHQLAPDRAAPEGASK